MTGTPDPISGVVGLTTAANVQKTTMVDYIKQRTALFLANAAEVNATDLTNRLQFMLRSNGAVYVYNAAESGADNGDTILADAAGNKFDKIVIPDVEPTARELLTTNRTYYVRTDGSDSNTGLVNSSGGAFLTIQKAWDVIADTLDLQGHTVTVQAADGTYTSGLSSSKRVAGAAGPESVVFQGNSGSPQNVIVTTTGTACFSAVLQSTQTATSGTQFTVKDMELRTTTSGSCLFVAGAGSAIHFTNLRFGTCAGAHIWAQHHAWVFATGDYAVTGNAQSHVEAETCSVIALHGRTITYSNSPAFSGTHIRALYASSVFVGSMTFTNGGTVTGTRYLAYGNGIVETFGGGANYIPGNVAGSVLSGGQYI